MPILATSAKEVKSSLVDYIWTQRAFLVLRISYFTPRMQGGIDARLTVR